MFQFSFKERRARELLKEIINSLTAMKEFKVIGKRSDSRRKALSDSTCENYANRHSKRMSHSKVYLNE